MDNRSSEIVDNLISAVVPVGEMSGRLKNLESWLSAVQEHPIQIILVCDLVGENCQKELEALVNSLDNNRLILISGKYGSPGATRNAGIDYCTSEWITFWDSDDIPNWNIALATASTVSPSDEIIIGGYEIRRDSDATVIQVNLPIYENFDENMSLVALNPGLWRILIRRDLLKEMRFTHFRMAEDHLFILQLDLPSRKIYFSKSIFYKYFLGDSLHLTSNKKALADLSHVIPITYGFLAAAKIAESKYVATFLAREFASLIKRGSFSDRISALYLLAQAPWRIRFNKTLQLLGRLFWVVKA